MDQRSAIQFSGHIAGDGPAFFKSVEDMGLEGIVSKRADSFYRRSPSRRWLKTKCWMVSEFVAVGAKIDSRGLPVATLVRETEAGPHLVRSAKRVIRLLSQLLLRARGLVIVPSSLFPSIRVFHPSGARSVRVDYQETMTADGRVLKKGRIGTNLAASRCAVGGGPNKEPEQ